LKSRNWNELAKHVSGIARRTLAAPLLAAMLLCAGWSGAHAQEWPSRPIVMLVPFAAGGNSDSLIRVVSEPLSKALAQPIVIENRGGASGLIATQAAARANPDGYTFVVSSLATQVILPVFNKAADFDAMRDFTHIAYIGGPPLMLLVHSGTKLKTFSDFLAWARKQAQDIDYVSPGIGSLGNLAVEYLASKTGLKLTHVPYRSGSLAMNDLIAGHVKVGGIALTSARAHILSGAVTPLAVTSAERVAEFPDVPTFKELGYPELVATTWAGISGPAGIPADIAGKLNRDVIAALATEKARQWLQQDAVLTEPYSPEQFTRFVQNEIDKWRPIAQHIVAANPASH
jgi:tripartite-type tricarboxylate transporter receptor subunit TctC